mmetsp:Transcript_26251/g.53525  ORF Transcript_26251/g.53525 Transcript_26251/m.53525 type:complete len:347 (+) Transcript_26251:588-1628(+)
MSSCEQRRKLGRRCSPCGGKRRRFTWRSRLEPHVGHTNRRRSRGSLGSLACAGAGRRPSGASGSKRMARTTTWGSSRTRWRRQWRTTRQPSASSPSGWQTPRSASTSRRKAGSTPTRPRASRRASRTASTPSSRLRAPRHSWSAPASQHARAFPHRDRAVARAGCHLLPPVAASGFPPCRSREGVEGTRVGGNCRQCWCRCTSRGRGGSATRRRRRRLTNPLSSTSSTTRRHSCGRRALKMRRSRRPWALAARPPPSPLQPPSPPPQPSGRLRSLAASRLRAGPIRRPRPPYPAPPASARLRAIRRALWRLQCAWRGSTQWRPSRSTFSCPLRAKKLTTNLKPCGA